jgi:hypothetical protein
MTNERIASSLARPPALRIKRSVAPQEIIRNVAATLSTGIGCGQMLQRCG